MSDIGQIKEYFSNMYGDLGVNRMLLWLRNKYDELKPTDDDSDDEA